MAELIHIKVEQSPYHDQACALFAYFKGKPTEEELLEAFKHRYPHASSLEEARDVYAYEPVERPDPISKLSATSRYFLCQAC